MSDNEPTETEQITEALGEIFTAMQRAYEPIAAAIAAAFTPELCDALAGAAKAEAARLCEEATRFSDRAVEHDDGSLRGAFLSGLDGGKARALTRRATELEAAAEKLARVHGPHIQIHVSYDQASPYRGLDPVMRAAFARRHGAI